MRITWSLPVPGEGLASSRGDVVRARHLVEELRRAGHYVAVVAASDHGSTRAAVTAYRGAVRQRLPRPLALALRDAGRLLHARTHARRVAEAARAQGAELLVETQVHGVDAGWRAARRTGLPLLLDDCTPSAEEAALGSGLPGLVRRQFRRQVAAAAVLVTSSEQLREAVVREGASPARVHVAPNGVDPSAFSGLDSAAARAAVRTRYGVGEGVVIGFVGSFQPWHRVERLVEAAARLPGLCPPAAVPPEGVRLLLVGDGPGRATALAAAARLGLLEQVVAPGTVPPGEVPALLAACDIGVLPGTNDYGHPMKLVEYAAAGLPAVAPDLPPVRAVVEDGATGLLFAPDDPGALARALARLVGDRALRARLGAAARARVAGWTWAARARALLDAYCSAPPSGDAR